MNSAAKLTALHDSGSLGSGRRSLQDTWDGNPTPREAFDCRHKLKESLEMMKSLIAVAGAGLLAAACTSTGTVERNAAGGAALGALAGAVIGNNVGSGSASTGAAIGAVAGGSAGAYKGCREDGGCGANVPNRRQYYDERAGRYYFYDSASQRYYWEDGQPRY